MRRGNKWNIRVVVVLLATACALSGCTESTIGEPAPVSPSAVASPSVAPPSPSPSSTPSPTPSPPEAPAGIEKDSTAGAKKAIQHFYDLRNFAYLTGDTRPLERLSMPDCGYCESSLSRAKDLHDRGDVLRGGAIDVTHVEYVSSAESGAQVFAYTLREEPWEVVDRSGQITSTSTSAQKFSGLVGLVRSPSASGWLVEDVDVDEKNS